MDCWLVGEDQLEYPGKNQVVYSNYLDQKPSKRLNSICPSKLSKQDLLPCQPEPPTQLVLEDIPIEIAGIAQNRNGYTLTLAAMVMDEMRYFTIGLQKLLSINKCAERNYHVIRARFQTLGLEPPLELNIHRIEAKSRGNRYWVKCYDSDKKFKQSRAELFRWGYRVASLMGESAVEVYKERYEKTINNAKTRVRDALSISV
jgi:hypothetical protein